MRRRADPCQHEYVAEVTPRHATCAGLRRALQRVDPLLGVGGQRPGEAVRSRVVQRTNSPEGRACAVFLESGQVFSLAHPPLPPLREMEGVEGQERECVGGGKGGWTPLGALQIHVGFE